ncbi:MAG: hypothetical protein Q8O19_05235 [Rectinemataceae bacterium]|nr:hypothetical protein [Rectinemataceae bacterium]
MKTLSFKIEDELHQGLKIGAAMEGRPIAEILKELIRRWVKGRDPFIHQVKNMPITPDEEEISPATLKAIQSAMKEKSGGTWEELSKELPTHRGE